MKDLQKWIGSLLFVLMSVSLIAYAASRTLNFITSTLGEQDQIIGYLALMATTGGAISWLATFLWNSKGIGQKGISVVMVAIDVIGEIALFITDSLMQSGNNGMIVALAPEEIRLVVLAMGFLIGLNVIAIFSFHILDADNMAAMEEQFAEWKIDKAIQKAKIAKATSIADEIAEREADLYGQAMSAKDRTDRTLPDRTLQDIFGSFLGKKGEHEKLPLAAVDTVELPTLKQEEPANAKPFQEPKEDPEKKPAWTGGFEDPNTGEIYGI